jgi:hypothetical protein
MPSRRHTLVRNGLLLALILLGLYGLLAYVALPSAWSHYEHQRGLEGQPMLTHTAQGISGDPLNVGLVGSPEDIVRAMHVAGWHSADPITFQTSLAIIGSVVLRRPDPDAPVSPCSTRDDGRISLSRSRWVRAPTAGITSGSGGCWSAGRKAAPYGSVRRPSTAAWA